MLIIIMALWTSQFAVWAIWRLARVQLPFCTARSLTFYHLLRDLAAATSRGYLPSPQGGITRRREHLWTQGLPRAAVAPVCDNMTSRGVWELQVVRLCFRSLAYVCHFKGMKNVLWGGLSRIAEGLWKRASNIAVLPGQFCVAAAPDHSEINL